MSAALADLNTRALLFTARAIVLIIEHSNTRPTILCPARRIWHLETNGKRRMLRVFLNTTRKSSLIEMQDGIRHRLSHKMAKNLHPLD